MMSQAGESQDAVDLIISDHRMVATLFEQLRAATTAEERQGLGEQIICDLSIHAAVEEQLLYPRARKLLSDDGLVNHAIEEHSELKKVLDRLDGKAPDDEGFMSGFTQAEQLVKEHVSEEETQLLPRLRAAASADELQKLGKAMATAKKAAPTHPHPHAPAKPPFNIVLGPIMGIVDKVRDAAKSHSG
jgi:hemerythrin superfamily protein